MNLRIKYQWIAMRDGQLVDGIYSASDSASTKEIAHQLSRSALQNGHLRGVTAYALCEIEYALPSREMLRRDIIEIEPIAEGK